jgi:DNA processing protein
MGESEQQDIRLTQEQRLDWLQLIRSENIGPRTFRLLLQHYGSAGDALDAVPELARRGGATRPGRICSRAEAENEFAAAQRRNVMFIASCEAAYPSRLRMIDDAPPLLSARGNLAALLMPMVAIVGSRNASAAGMKMAEILARNISAEGFAIVSGLARGIDGAAHRGSLDAATVAVLAGGHDHIYPPEHKQLFESILQNGTGVSEMPLGHEPRAGDFPRRNRLISGLALGVVVIEAAKRSGSLITVRFALEQGREVFAVPGSPLDPRAEGSNALLKQGATLVTEAEDVLVVLRPILGTSAEVAAREPEHPLPRPPGKPGADERGRIIALLGPTPVTVDDLVRMSGATPGIVQMVLLELDLAGRLERHGGGLVALTDGRR